MSASHLLGLQGPQQTSFVWMWQANAKTVITLLLSLCSASSGCSSGIPLLLLHVTIEGRPHSSARELRGDGLKITPKDGMKEIVEQRKQKEGQDFFSRFSKSPHNNSQRVLFWV